MEDIVRQAMAKWPNVPHCWGWLGLDARGNWYMRDDRAQTAGTFLQSKGSLLKHEKLIDFIARNYEHDEHGQWFFQNGPQRVYVELEAIGLSRDIPGSLRWLVEPIVRRVSQASLSTSLRQTEKAVLLRTQLSKVSSGTGSSIGSTARAAHSSR